MSVKDVAQYTIADTELVRRITADNCPAATSVLVERYASRVRAFVYPLLLNHADADDVTQIALLRALDNLASYRFQAAFSTWLYRIAVNVAKNYLRQQNRHNSCLSIDAEVNNLPSSIDYSPVAQLELNETADNIKSALQELPFDQRTAITLVVIEGHDYQTAAAISKCNPATLRWRLHRARQRLFQILSERGDL